MFVSKKEYNELKQKVETQEKHLDQAYIIITSLEQSITELKKPQEPIYFK